MEARWSRPGRRPSGRDLSTMPSDQTREFGGMVVSTPPVPRRWAGAEAQPPIHLAEEHRLLTRDFAGGKEQEQQNQSCLRSPPFSGSPTHHVPLNPHELCADSSGALERWSIKKDQCHNSGRTIVSTMG